MSPGVVERQAVASSANGGGDSPQEGSLHGMSVSGHHLTASGHPVDLGLYHRQLLAGQEKRRKFYRRLLTSSARDSQR